MYESDFCMTVSDSIFRRQQNYQELGSCLPHHASSVDYTNFGLDNSLYQNDDDDDVNDNDNDDIKFSFITEIKPSPSY